MSASASSSESLDILYELFQRHLILTPIVIAIIFWLHYYLIYTIFGAIKSLIGFAIRVLKTVVFLWAIFGLVYVIKTYDKDAIRAEL